MLPTDLMRCSPGAEGERGAELNRCFKTLWREKCAQTSALRTNDDPGAAHRLRQDGEGRPGGGAGPGSPGEYLAMERCAAEVAVTADYGQQGL